jgi:hypothetical protein
MAAASANQAAYLNIQPPHIAESIKILNRDLDLAMAKSE